MSGRPRPPRLLALVALAALGCEAAADAGAPPVALVGQWRYAATQSAPVGATLAGTLVVQRQRGRDLDGTMDVRETDGQGRVRQLAGPVAGRTPDAETADFDAFLGPVGRRHVGRVQADTIAGSWIESAGGGAASSGTFRLERVR